MGDIDLDDRPLQACDELESPRQGPWDIVELRDTQDMEPFLALREPREDERALLILASEGLDAMRCRPFRSLCRPFGFDESGGLTSGLGPAVVAPSEDSTNSSGRREVIVVGDGSTVEGPKPGRGEGFIEHTEEKQEMLD
jgi:hypothetical protein